MLAMRRRTRSTAAGPACSTARSTPPPRASARTPGPTASCWARSSINGSACRPRSADPCSRCRLTRSRWPASRGGRRRRRRGWYAGSGPTRPGGCSRGWPPTRSRRSAGRSRRASAWRCRPRATSSAGRRLGAGRSGSPRHWRQWSPPQGERSSPRPGWGPSPRSHRRRS